MSKLARLLAAAVRRVAADPRLQKRAKEVFEQGVKPRAEQAWRQNKPKLQAKADELQKFARKNAKRENVEKFAKAVRDRLRDGPKDK